MDEKGNFTKGSDAICHIFFCVFVRIDQFIYIYIDDCKGKKSLLIRNNNFEIPPLLGLAVALKLQMCLICCISTKINISVN